MDYSDPYRALAVWMLPQTTLDDWGLGLGAWGDGFGFGISALGSDL